MSTENQDQIETEMETELPEGSATPPNNEDDPYERARKEVENVYAQALRDSQRQALAAQRLAEERAAELAAVRVNNEEPISGAEFLNNPNEHISSIVRREIKEALSGINELARGMRTQSKFSTLKNQFLIHPSLGALYKQVEIHVDNMMSSLSDVELTPEAFQAAILSTYGAAQAGLLPGFANKREEKVSTLPASPPNPNRKPEQKKPTGYQLTESQRRVARIQGLTDEEYIAALESDGTIDDLNSRLG
jgi:hypothetical protein